MSKFRKILMSAMSVVLACVFVVCIGAAGNEELSITAKSTGKGKLEIKLTNTSEYYLGNVNIKVSPAEGSGTKINSYGVSGSGKTGVDPVRALAPGGSVSVDVNLATGGGNKPSATTGANKKPGATNGNGVVVENPGAVVENPSIETDGTTASSDETKTDKGDKTTEVGTVHSIAPGESATVMADMNEESGEGTDGGASGEKGEDDGNFAVWIIVASAIGAVVIAGVVAFVILRKKKSKIAKDISSVIVIAILLGALVGARGDLMTSSAADAVTAPTAGSMSTTFALSDGSGSVVVTADYIIAPKAVVQPIKNTRRAPSSDDCNQPKVDQRRIKEGAGPLTGLNIYVGKGDMMFFGDAIKDYRGQTIMQSARLNKISNMMNERDKWAKENGIKLYLVIAPNKTTVYDDYVPSSVPKGAKSNADVVIEHLANNSTVGVIDLRGALKNARATYGDNLFYKYDTHWNYNGGFVGYSEVMRRINEDVPGAYTLKSGDFDISSQETYMKDMAWYLGFYSTYQDFGPMYTLRSGMTASLISKGNYDVQGQFKYAGRWSDGYSDSLKFFSYENKFNEGAPSLYMYRDSFSVAMVHFFKDSFHSSTFDWSYDFNKSEILASGANVVVMEVVEKQLLEFSNSRPFTN